MSNNRRNFIKSFGGSAAIVGLGGIPLISCTSNAKKKGIKETTSEQVLEISEKGSIVDTQYGKVRGYRRNGIYTYLGIPYGGPTSCKNRFMAPTSPEKWTGIRNALYWGPSAPQNSGFYGNANNFKEVDMDHFSSAFTNHWEDKYYGEDCLRINIWTPSINDISKRPVLLWLHGGGFEHGSSINLAAYIGENLSKSGDVVVCTINHRLNAFGYINLGALGGEKFKDSANSGMLDIVASMKWIKKNISCFGGDPSNVTIFGQSGGGAKVSTIMAMPAAKGLFHKAITMSGAVLRISESDKTGELAELVLKEAGLSKSQTEKIQELSWMDFFELTSKVQAKISNKLGGNFSPCVDGLHIPQHPFDPAAPKISAGIPMIIGNCTGEMPPSVNDPSLENISFDELKKTLSKPSGSKFMSSLGINADKIVDAYAKSFPNKKPIEIWGLLAWNMRPNAIIQAERQIVNEGSVYNYWFNWHTPLYDGRLRAYHNSDIPFWFNNTDIMDSMTGGGERPKLLADKMSQALIHFARTGDPNHSGIPNWPKYDSYNGAVMIWDDVCKVENDPDREARNIFNNLIGDQS
jgi:para-nitrobenzyl esterase